MNSHNFFLKTIELALALVLCVACGVPRATATLVPSADTPTPLPPTSTVTPRPLPTCPPLPELHSPSIEAPGWDGRALKTVCIVEDATFEGLATRPEGLDTLAAARAIVKGLGMKPVGETGPCDAVLTIRFVAKALDAVYVPGGRCYTGADLRGNIELSAVDKPTISKPFVCHRDPPGTVTVPKGGSCNQSPEKAPFSSLWQEGFLDTLPSIWGMRVYVAAAGDPHLGDAAMDLLRDSSLDDDRLDALILLLADPNTESNYVSLTGLLALLSEMGKAAQRAAPYIKPILFDEQASYPIRLAAMRTLRSMDALTPAAVPPLLQLMSVIGISDDPLANDTRRDIAETIGRIRPIEKPFAALRKASTSRDQATRSAAVHGLAWIGPEASLAIVQALQDPSEPVRISASEVLVGRSGTEAVPLVIQVMQDADPETLSIAAQTLSRLSGHNFGEDPDHWQEWWDEMVALMNAIDTKEEIVSALDHEEGAIRMYAIERAEQMGPQIVGAIPGLTRILENETGLSIRAAEALAAIGSDAVPALVQAVDSQEMVTSAGGMFGLCEIGPPAALEAVPALINKLRESELNYPYSLKVLVCVTEEYLGRDADAWAAWWAGQQ